MFGKMLCSIGLHDHPEWTYQSENCRQTRACKRCQHEENRLAHQWTDWGYTADTACFQARWCHRCGEAEPRVHHESLRWVFVSPDSCEQVEICDRCDQIVAEGIFHAWGVWEYESPVSCVLVRFCRRCNERDIGDMVHKWGELQDTPDPEEKKSVCDHCGLVGYFPVEDATE